jgi:CubicO group peptidase (beta-lactamase class C family)
MPVDESLPEGLLPCTRRALLHRLATAQVDGRAPSIVAAVVRGGALAWAAGRGEVDGSPPDERVAYRIGSVTKPFTAVLVMRLRDEGRLELSDPIDKHLPDTAVGHLTVAQLLAHAGGISAEPPGPWWERTPGALRPTLPDVLGDDAARHPPGRRFHYSNPGYAVLGALVERLRGAPWEEALRAEILDPLDMPETGVQPPGRHARGWAVHPWAELALPEPAEDYGPMAPAGQLWSTAADLCRFASFLAAGDDRVLSAGTLEEMRMAAAPPDGPDPATGYGLGVQVLWRDGHALVGHGGSVPGFLAGLVVHPQDGTGAVVLANTTAGIPITNVTADLLRIVTEREPRIPEPWRPSSDPDPSLLGLTGTWYWGPAPLVLRIRAGRELEIGPVAGGGRATRLRPEPDGTWLGLDGYYAGERLRVVRGPQGAVTHLDLGTFVFTRQPYDPHAPVPGGVDPKGWRGAGDGSGG